jgi:hypothetical protein
MGVPCASSAEGHAARGSYSLNRIHHIGLSFRDLLLPVNVRVADVNKMRFECECYSIAQHS